MRSLVKSDGSDVERISLLSTKRRHINEKLKPTNLTLQKIISRNKFSSYSNYDAIIIHNMSAKVIEDIRLVKPS